MNPPAVVPLPRDINGIGILADGNISFRVPGGRIDWQAASGGADEGGGVLFCGRREPRGRLLQ